jgi:hypothetical protein
LTVDPDKKKETFALCPVMWISIQEIKLQVLNSWMFSLEEMSLKKYVAFKKKFSPVHLKLLVIKKTGS